MKLFNDFSIRVKLLTIGGLAALLVALIGTIGVWGITNVDGAMDEISVNGTALRNHMSADMMHDALRGDVLASLLWAENRDPGERETIETDLAEHVDWFRTSLAANDGLPLGNSIETAIVDIGPVLNDYIRSAENLTALAFDSPQAAREDFAGFLVAFTALEDKMEALSELIENSSQVSQVSGDQAVVVAKYTIVGMALVALVIMFSLTILIAGLISRPLKHMVEGLEQLADGNLTVSLSITSKDEIGVMAQAFNASVSKLSQVLFKILGSSKEVQNAASQISAASEQLAAGAEEQQAQLSEVATTMEQMSAMILEASKNASETRESARQTGSTASLGREVVLKTVSGFETVANTVEQAAKQIQELNRRSEEIGNVIQVIDDIADQTNLLALNANIEAARAGDAGRGFAVVADEVRKLAERTVSATAEISSMIETIQTDIQQAVKSMDVIQSQSRDGLELVAKSDESLEEISGSIRTVVAAVEQIATASSEQSTGAEQISKNIEGVSTVAKESAASAQEMAVSAEQLNKEVADLNGLIGQFRME